MLAAAATLALNPRAAGEPGWQLSFAAVVALLVAAPPLRKALARRMPAPVADAAAITIAATIGTAPLMALYFEQVSLASLPANLLAAPAIAPIMWLGVLAAAAAQVAEPFATPFTTLAAPLLVYVQQVAHHTSHAPLATVDVNADPVVIVAAWAALALASGLALRRWASRPRRVSRRVLATAVAAGLGAVLVVPGVVQGGAPTPAADEVVVSFLDVGQGDATLVQRGRTSVLIDTGAAGRPDPDRLSEAGIDRLDALIAHARGSRPRGRRAAGDRGVHTAARGQRRRRLAVARATAAARRRTFPPRAGQVTHARRPAVRGAVAAGPRPRTGGRAATRTTTRWSRGSRPAGSRCCWPPTPRAASPHRCRSTPVDVLKVAHHGSADPGLPALLERLQPRVAAIEVGKENTLRPPGAIDARSAQIRRADRAPDRPRRHRPPPRGHGGRMWIEGR